MTTQPPSAHIGKISRLPHDIREQLNLRLQDNQSATEILPWLNDLPEVKEIMAAQFTGVPISPRNLSAWRSTGYREWLNEQQAARVATDTRFAQNIHQAGAGSIARSAATFASSQFLELLDTPAPRSLDDLVKITTTVAPLLKAEQNFIRLEQNNLRIDLAKKRLAQQDEHLLLARDKHQRDIIAIVFRFLGDERAKEIVASDLHPAEKIELLGLHTFADEWIPRHIPTEEEIAHIQKLPSEPSSAAPKCNEDGSSSTSKSSPAAPKKCEPSPAPLNVAKCNQKM